MNRHQPEEARLERLLRAVGPRPEVPPDAIAEAHTTALAAWQATVSEEAARKRRRYATVWLAAAAILVTFGLLRWFPFVPSDAPTPASPTLAHVTWLKGEVACRDEGSPLALNDPLPAGCTLESSNGRIALRLEGGASLRLASNSLVQWIAPGRIELLAGTLYIDKSSGPPVEVLTRFGVIRDVGTQFEVHVGEGDGPPVVRVRVREGRVLFDSPQSTTEVEANAGEELRILDQGQLERGTVSIHGPEWDWVLATAPPFDMDGRTLGEFLEWLCREGGWELSYRADEAALSSLLYGEAEGLELIEAAQMVIQGSGMHLHIEDGVLVIESANAL